MIKMNMRELHYAEVKKRFFSQEDSKLLILHFSAYGQNVFNVEMKRKT